MNTKICSFSGHRAIPPAAEPQLRRLVRQRIAALASEGCTGFLCGGAVGFDTLAAEEVLAERVLRPELTLSLALPCPDQDKSWPAAARRRFRRILEEADEAILVSPEYHRYCMAQRNRFMVDHSCRLICYLTEERGGTAFTVRYALKAGIPVENLATELV